MAKRKFSFTRFKESTIAWTLAIIITFAILSISGYLFYGILLLLGSEFGENGAPFIVKVIGMGVMGLFFLTILFFTIGIMWLVIKNTFNFFFPIQKDNGE